jgi:hypothetical protein
LGVFRCFIPADEKFTAKPRLNDSDEEMSARKAVAGGNRQGRVNVLPSRTLGLKAFRLAVGQGLGGDIYGA